MSPVQPNNFEKLVTLKQASEILGVSIETLLSWNQHNILKPTITSEGEIGYTKNQLNQFLAIRQIIQKNETNSENTQAAVPQMQPTRIEADENVPAPTRPAGAFFKTSKTKPHFPKIITSFAALLVILTIVVLPQLATPLIDQDQINDQEITENNDKILGTQTSKLNISRQSISALPIQLHSETTTKKNLNDEGENISKEKIIAPELYEVISAKNTLAANDEQNQAPFLRPRPTDSAGNLIESTIGDTTDLASVGFFDTCTSCKEDKDSAIDESGNIKGEISKEDTLAAVVGGINAIVKNDSSQQINTDTTNTTNQLVFLSLGVLAAFFVLQKQFAYPIKKLPTAQKEPYRNQAALSSQKTLEIGQKTDGTVVLLFMGKEYKISKPEMNSESDRFIERLMQLAQPDMKEIEYDTAMAGSVSVTTPLSRLVTRLGFVGIKRDLFFPRTSKNSVLFRRYLTQQDLALMNLTPNQILKDLTGTS